MYRIVYERKAAKGLAAIPAKDRSALIGKIKIMAEDPYKASGVKQLRGKQFKGFYRIRHGDYRAIYTINNEEIKVVVLQVSKRDKVYK